MGHRYKAGDKKCCIIQPSKNERARLCVRDSSGRENKGRPSLRIGGLEKWQEGGPLNNAEKYRKSRVIEDLSEDLFTFYQIKVKLHCEHANVGANSMAKAANSSSSYARLDRALLHYVN